ncbi:MAG: MarR family transcriptional regulator [Candidatus Bipolaricaulota bacterium]|nr:MarR family transcriptional regulator [Candidatus Bipolaricaulota bacterium]
MATERRATPGECARAVLETTPLIMQSLRTQMRNLRGALSVPQFRALAFLGRRPRSSLSDVAQHVGTSLPSMSKLIDGLVTRGLIERGPEADDRRRVALSLTRDGRRLLDMVHDVTQARLSGLFGGLSAAERAAIVDAMKLVSPLFSVPEST